MKRNVCELEGADLDALVAKLEGHDLVHPYAGWIDDGKGGRKPVGHCYSWSWALAGPIIEREKIGIGTYDFGRTWAAWGYGKAWGVWSIDATATEARCDPNDPDATGPTPLIAAMRAYVASKFGETVELP